MQQLKGHVAQAISSGIDPAVMQNRAIDAEA